MALDRDNPAQAGLVKHPEDWPYGSAFWLHRHPESVDSPGNADVPSALCQKPAEFDPRPFAIPLLKLDFTRYRPSEGWLADGGLA